MLRPARLTLFGGFRLETGAGASVAVPTAKGRAVLGYLACAKGRNASRERLALLLWSDSDSRKARQNLRQVMLKLSRTLGAQGLSILRHDGQHVVLQDQGLGVDVWAFESLVDEGSTPALLRAMRLYQGELLQGLALDTPVLDDWLLDARSHFQDRALNCAHTLLERQRKAGDLDAAIATANRALAIDPCQETAHRELMALYLANGQRGAALNQYRACRAKLLRELDVVPDETTEALLRRIRAETAVPSAVSIPGRGEVQAALQEPVVSAAPIGRDQDLKDLHDAFRAVGDGGARLAALRGEAGIGKTRLLDVFATDLSRRGVPVYRAAARRAERPLSLGLWGQIEEALGGPAVEDLARVSSALREVSAPYLYQLEAAGAAPRAAGDQWSGPFDAVLDKLREAASTGPLAVIVEDVQWADGPSLRLLSRALHVLGQAPVLMVTAARPGGASTPARFAAILHDLERAGLVWDLEIGPLSFTQSMTLIDQASSASGAAKLSDRWRKSLWALAEGNPQILLEGLRRPDATNTPALPLNLLQGARHDLEHLSRPARRLVQFASLMQVPFGSAVCARAAGLSSSRAAEALDEAIAAKLLRGQGECCAFERPWFRKAVHDDLHVFRCHVMHAAIAKAIEHLYAGELAPHYRALARHWRAAGQVLAAAEYGLFDLEYAFARGARRRLPKAMPDLTRSLSGQASGARVESVHWRAGALRAAIAEANADPAGALAELRALERRRPTDDDPTTAVALFHALSRASCLAGKDDEARHYARRTLRCSARHGGMAGPWHLAERLLFRLHLHGPIAARLAANLETRAQRARRLGIWSELGEIAAAQAMMAGLGGHAKMLEVALASARGAVAKQRDPRAEAALLQIEGLARTWAGGAAGGPAALAALERALTLARETGDLIRACVIRGLRGQGYLALSRLAEARADLEQAIAAAADLGPVPYLPLYHACLAEVSRRDGQPKAALRESLHAWRLSQGQAWARPPILRALAGALTQAKPCQAEAAAWLGHREIAQRRALGLPGGFNGWGAA